VADIIVISGQSFKRRNIFAVWLGLPIITLGIYTFVWYYKINDEAKRYLNDPSINPGRSLIAILLGWILILPPFISIYGTAKRIQRMQGQAGMPNTVTPWVAVALVFVFRLETLYLQSELNRVWDRYRALPPVPAAPFPPAPILPPPPAG
jgi:hypothetical protein